MNMSVEERDRLSTYLLAFAEYSPPHYTKKMLFGFLALSLQGTVWNFLDGDARAALWKTAVKEYNIVKNEWDIEVGGKRTLPWWLSPEAIASYSGNRPRPKDNGNG